MFQIGISNIGVKVDMCKKQHTQKKLTNEMFRKKRK